MFKTIVNHLATRRKWNRTKRWMHDRAYSRALICYQGCIWKR